MKPTLRHLLLTAALLGSAGLVLFSDPPTSQPDIAAPAARPAPNTPINTASQPQQQATLMAPTTTRLLARAARDYDMDPSTKGMRAINGSYGTTDLFAAHDWAPPQPSSQRSGQISVDTAPPLPFTLIGKHQTDGKWEVFLASGKHNYVVHEQDVINDQYKIESIRPPVMTLVYLPLNTKQILQIGDFE